MAHVKPKNCCIWDVHAEVGFNIGTAMEHHHCFHVYIIKTRATRVSNAVFFKHQDITNLLTPETLVMKAASELTSALKGTVLRDAETADALATVSNLFHKIAEAKAAMAKAKEQRNHHRTHPNARQTMPLPRVVNKPSVPLTAPLPRVQVAPASEDCCVGCVGDGVQIVENTTLQQGRHEPPIPRPPTQIVGSRLQIVQTMTP